MKYLLIISILVSSLTTFFITKKIYHGNNLKSDSTSDDKYCKDLQEKFNNIKSKFQLLSQIDIDEYLNLKSQEEKYKKADEILSKVILVFLADVGVKLAQNQLAFAGTTIKNISKDNTGITTNSEQPISSNISSLNQNSTELENSSNKNSLQEGNHLKNEVGELKNIKSEKDIQPFLKKVVISNLSEETLKITPQSKIYNTFNETFSGSYSGSIEWDNKKEVSSMTLRLSLNKEKSEIDVDSVILFSGGDHTSRSTGKVQDTIYLFKKSSEAILLRIGSTDYIQLYYIEKMNMLVGNYYETKSFGKIIATGRIRLNKN